MAGGGQKHVIRLGDSTSHGGVVTSAVSNFNMFGKNVARIGDTCTCPVNGHNNCVIVEGDPNWVIDGKAVALEGHKTSCGATLISSLSTVSRSNQENQLRAETARSANGVTETKKRPTVYDEQAQLSLEGDLKQLVGLPYFIEMKSGKTLSGLLDESAKLPRITTEGPDEYVVYWGDAALERMKS